MPGASANEESTTVTMPSESPTEADLISASLIESRGRNARFMNGIRFFVILGFNLVYFVFNEFINVDADTNLRWQTQFHLLIYLIAAGALWLLSFYSAAVRNGSRFAVPFFDMPMVTWIQGNIVARCLTNRDLELARENPDFGNPDVLEIINSAGSAQAYLLAALVMLTAMSSFSLRARYLIPSSLMAILCLVLVYRQVETGGFFYSAGILIILATAALMSWLPRRQAALVREAANRQARRNRLARYFSPGVANYIEGRDDPGVGEECEISVLFCDIRGFTGLSEGLEASEVVALLNDFHGSMVEEIFRYGGTLDKFLGDGLLAWFNAPVRQQDHAVLAVKCALSMLESLERLNRDREASGQAPLRIGIGIHAGKAVVGNIGAKHRKEFTAVGDTVNVASRLENLTRAHDTSIIVSNSVLSDIGDPAAHGFVFQSCGTAEVRGRQKPVEIFTPSGTTPVISSDSSSEESPATSPDSGSSIE